MTTELKRFISKEEINELPMLDFAGRLEVIESAEQALTAVEALAREKVLGFDTETKPTFVKGQSHTVAMLQLGTEDCAYLFRLNKFTPPPELGRLLADPGITKAGVAIHDDLKGLQKIMNFTPQGFVDLAKEAEKRGFSSLGLRALSAIFLGVRLSKAAKITNWERSTLTEAQLQYAACDAWVGLKIYQKMFLS